MKKAKLGIDRQNMLQPLKNQRGSVMIAILMVLMILTMLGIFALDTTITELHLAGNDKSSKIAFNNADAGIYTIPKLASLSLNAKSTFNLGNSAPFTYLDSGTDDTGTDNTFYRELAGFSASDAAPDVSFSNDDNQHTVKVDVKRLWARTLSGGGAEFSAGMEGSGASLKGVYMELESTGEGPNNSQSVLGANYLHVINSGH